MRRGASAFLVLLAACMRDGDATADSSAATLGPTADATPSPSPATWTMSEGGWGPIRAGMTVGAARAALGQVARVEVTDSVVATTAGARVGDTETRINQLYPGRVQTSPHKYTDGHYLTVRGSGADSVQRLVFETDGQRVTRYRGGRVPEVEWVEGCS